jgi:hypothetical protein
MIVKFKIFNTCMSKYSNSNATHVPVSFKQS